MQELEALGRQVAREGGAVDGRGGIDGAVGSGLDEDRLVPHLESTDDRQVLSGGPTGDWIGLGVRGSVSRPCRSFSAVISPRPLAACGSDHQQDRACGQTHPTAIHEASPFSKSRGSAVCLELLCVHRKRARCELLALALRRLLVGLLGGLAAAVARPFVTPAPEACRQGKAQHKKNNSPQAHLLPPQQSAAPVARRVDRISPYYTILAPFWQRIVRLRLPACGPAGIAGRRSAAWARADGGRRMKEKICEFPVTGWGAMSCDAA